MTDLGDFVDSMVNDTVVLPPFMTSDECIAMCDYKNKEDYLFYGSLAVNALLLVTTSVSEIMSACKCEATGVFDGIVLLVRKASGSTKKKETDRAVNLRSLNSEDLKQVRELKQVDTEDLEVAM